MLCILRFLNFSKLFLTESQISFDHFQNVTKLNTQVCLNLSSTLINGNVAAEQRLIKSRGSKLEGFLIAEGRSGIRMKGEKTMRQR